MSFPYHCIDQDEATFLYHEIFDRQSYLQHGISLENQNHVPLTVVDIGANIGLFSLFVCQHPHCATGVEIVAVEPMIPCCHVFHRNMSQFLEQSECPSSVRLLNCAVGQSSSEMDTVAFHYYPSTPGESTRNIVERTEQRSRLYDAAMLAGKADMIPPDEQPAETYQVPLRSIQSICDELGLMKIDLLKIDVEGDEIEVLHSIGEANWSLIRQIVIEIHDINERLASAVNLLTGQGYQCTLPYPLSHLINYHSFSSIIHSYILLNSFSLGTTVPQQNSLSDDGYMTFIPDELKLYMVYAIKR